MSFLASLLWGLCLGLSFLGLGFLVLRVLAVRSLPLPLVGSLGAAVFITLGGILNLLHLVSTVVLIPLVLGCDGVAVLVLWNDRKRLKQPLSILGRHRASSAVLLCFLSVPVLGNIHADVRSFSWYDDLPAYLTLPVQTVQLQRLPSDPFNERRITSSLGAPYVLQAVLLAVGDAQDIRFVDCGLGTLLYAGCLWSIFRVLRVSKMHAIIGLFCIFLIPVFRLNATFVVLPAALFCSLFLLFIPSLFRTESNKRQAFLLGLIVAALLALKSTYLPPAVLIVTIFYAVKAALTQQRRPVTTAAIFCFLVTALCCVPWMVDSKLSEGTWLFPLLGRGYDASAYGTVPLPSGSHAALASGAFPVWLAVLPMAGPLLLAATTVIVAYRQQRFDQAYFPALLAMLVGSALAILVLGASTGGESLGRYSLPFQIPALLIFAAFLLRWRAAATRHLWWWKPVAMILILTFVSLALLFGVHHQQYRVFLQDARVLTPPEEAWYQPDVERQRLQAIQSHIPAGERMLARLFVTNAFDFRRNTIYIADYTGMAGLPPGMPLDGNADSMAHYLLSHGIHYLAYDYRRTNLPDDDPQTSVQSVLRNPRQYGRHGWLYMQVKVSNFEGSTFSKMGKVVPHLYDDGTAFLLDLRQFEKPIARSEGSPKQSS